MLVGTNPLPPLAVQMREVGSKWMRMRLSPHFGSQIMLPPAVLSVIHSSGWQTENIIVGMCDSYGVFVSEYGFCS